ncbi:MAG: DUF3592 domain-containing protein [Anaerolineales bacterium]
MAFLCLSCAFFPAGIVLMVVGIRQGRGRTQGTLPTRGRILDASVIGNESEDEAPAVDLQFEYEAGGRSYQAEQRVTSWLFRMGGNLPNFMDRFGPGSEIGVRYDPSQPSQAAVDLGWTWTGAPLILLGAFLLIFSIAPFIPGNLWLQFFGAVWLLFSVFLMIRGIIELQETGVESWPNTIGRIVDSQVLSAEGAPGEPPTWWLELRYSYELDGEQYQGRRIKSGGPVLVQNKSYVEESAGKYPVGKRISVYYNPDDPSEAVLEKGSSRGWLFIALGVLIFLSIVAVTIGSQILE